MSASSALVTKKTAVKLIILCEVFIFRTSLPVIKWNIVKITSENFLAFSPYIDNN